MSDTSQVFKERLNDLIAEQFETKQDFYESVPDPVNTVKNWVYRGILPEYSRLLWLADFFHVSVDYLIGQSDHAAADTGLSDRSVSTLALMNHATGTDTIDQGIRQNIDGLNLILENAHRSYNHDPDRSLGHLRSVLSMIDEYSRLMSGAADGYFTGIDEHGNTVRLTSVKYETPEKFSHMITPQTVAAAVRYEILRSLDNLR